MVVPQEVEEPVDDEVRDLAGVRPARGAGLGPGRLERDIDFAEEDAVRRVGEGFGGGERKREDVGGLVGFSIIAIQAPDEIIPRENEGDRGVGAVEEAERAAEERSKSGRS